MNLLSKRRDDRAPARNDEAPTGEKQVTRLVSAAGVPQIESAGRDLAIHFRRPVVRFDRDEDKLLIDFDKARRVLSDRVVLGSRPN